MRIDCANCGSGFIYPNQPADCHAENNQPAYCYAGEKLSYCPNCKTSFSRQADRMSSDHVLCHQTDKMHCCVCGQIYQFSCFKISRVNLMTAWKYMAIG